MIRFFVLLVAGLSIFCAYAPAVMATDIALPLPPDVSAIDASHRLRVTGAELSAVAQELIRRYPAHHDDGHIIVVDVRQQRLYLLHYGTVQKSFRVSTSQWGIGNRAGSNRTPIGVFQIAEKFGEGAAAGTIFKSRRDTDRLAKIVTNPQNRTERDLVTSRIMWLTGLQPGFNEGGDVDTHSRYIYIHGTPEEGRIGMPSSHGCVRMKNADVIELFKLVGVGTLVYIASGDYPLTRIPGHE